jgi:PIN domain nuclease of toxin-antitoxin system
MKILLDTHIWIWHLIGSAEMGRKHRRILEDDSSEIWLSPISIWETSLLIERKRLPVKQTAKEWINAALIEFPIKEASLTFSIANRSRIIKLSHEDPADRFIAATAAEMKLTLLTADHRLKNCQEIQSA